MPPRVSGAVLTPVLCLAPGLDPQMLESPASPAKPPPSSSQPRADTRTGRPHPAQTKHPAGHRCVGSGASVQPLSTSAGRQEGCLRPLPGAACPWIAEGGGQGKEKAPGCRCLKASEGRVPRILHCPSFRAGWTDPPLTAASPSALCAVCPSVLPASQEQGTRGGEANPDPRCRWPLSFCRVPTHACSAVC